VIAAAISAAVAAVVSALVGAGLGRAAGCREWRGWMPALGLAALFAVLLLVVRLPGHGATAAVVACLGAALGGWFGRDALRGFPWREAVPVVIVLLALTAIPFVVDGRFGPLGQSINNDLAFHMAWADWLGIGRSVQASGYPLGPHSVIAALARLPVVGVDEAFAGLLMAVPALTGVCALDFVGDLSRRLRFVVAVMAGVPYLAISYYAQASFKEPQMALFFLAAVSVVQSPHRRTRAVVLAVLGAGSIACFSAPSVAWIVLAALVALVVGRGVRVGRRTALALGALLVLAVLVTVPTGFFDSGPGRYVFRSSKGPGGNFRGELNPLEVIGIWPSPDFQVPRPGAAWVAALAVGVVAAALGLWAWRRRDVKLPAVALLAALALAAVSAAVTVPYLSAKALVVAAPLTMVVVLAGLFGSRPRRTPAAVAWAVGCAIFVALAVHSSLLALRGAAVGPPAAGDELESLGAVARGAPTLFLGEEPYAPWYLRATQLTIVPRTVLYGAAPALFSRHGKGGGPQPGFADFDSPPGYALTQARYVVAPHSGYSSRPPASFRLVRATRRYLLYRRVARPQPRGVLDDEQTAPGATLRCGKGVKLPSRTASVIPAPVFAPAQRWRQLNGVPLAGEGTEGVLPPTYAARMRLRLPPGRWSVTMAYRARFDTSAVIDGRRVTLPAFMGQRSSPLGLGEVSGGREVVIQATAAYRPHGVANVASFIGPVTATRVGVPARSLPLRRACGLYVDFFSAR
jgi:hypothetical protein